MKLRTISGRLLIAVVTLGALSAPGFNPTVTAQIPSAPTNVRLYAGTAVPGTVVVTVSPVTATVQPGASVQFTATVSGTSNTSIVWRATGGSVSGTGLFMAGSTTGTYSVQAILNGGTIGGSASVTIQPSTTGTYVDVTPGQDIQAQINALPVGTAFRLRAGVHRLPAPLYPKEGQSFLGEPGAIVSGARLLGSFTRSGSYWVVSGQTQQGEVIGTVADEVCRMTRCGYPEDLFIDDRLLQHVGTLAEVGPGKWYFDYANDRIYFYDDPTGRRVEASVTPFAFGGFVGRVAIRGLIVEKFASVTHDAAINGKGAGWITEDNEVRWNHFTGIRTVDYAVSRRNRVHHNGAFGYIGAGAGVLVEDNEISYNNTVGYNPYWAAGGSKWVYTDGLIVRRNFSHHNAGPGLWTDIDNINTLYEGNRVEDNDLSGIFHEISYRATIRNNTISRNGRAKPSPWWVDGAGILVASSADVEVYGNTLVDNFQGIGGLEGHRGSGNFGVWELRNLYAHDNSVRQTGTLDAGSGRTGIVETGGLTTAFTSKNNRWVNNTYYLGAAARYFIWVGKDVTESEWRGYGQDVTGTFIR